MTSCVETVSLSGLAPYVQQSCAASQELQRAGSKPRHVGIASIAAGLSVQQPLDANGQMVRCLVNYGYPYRALPAEYTDCKALFLQPSGKYAGMFGESHHKAILRAESLASTGKLDFLLCLPDTIEEQREQRQWAFDLLNGYPFGWKAISFIQGILQPSACQQIAIDRHHLRILKACSEKTGEPLNGAPLSRASYENLENVYVDAHRAWLANGGQTCSLAEFGWAFWERERKENAHSSKADSEHAESHANLSSSWY